MKVKGQVRYSSYEQWISRLVFAEDQATLYTEGFVVLSNHPFIRRQLTLLETETNRHSRSSVSIFERAESNQPEFIERAELEVSAEMALVVDMRRVVRYCDESIVSAAIRLQEYLVEQYIRACARLRHSSSTEVSDRMTQILSCKRARLDALRRCLSDLASDNRAPVALERPNKRAFAGAIRSYLAGNH